MVIPLNNLRAQHEEVRLEIDEAIQTIIDQSTFSDGPFVERFEQDFAAAIGVRRAVACASGTDAIKLALMAAGVRPGDEVITAANAFVAGVEAILLVRAHPVFVDIDPDTYTLSPRALKTFLEQECYLGRDGLCTNRRSGRRVTCILPVHLYGLMADMQPILDLGARYNLVVVEDASQAHGASCNLDGIPVKAGSFGQVSAFSFSPDLNLGAMGEAGAVVSDDELEAHRMRLWCNHGARQKNIHISANGWNGQTDSLQCAVLGIKLKKLDEWNARRRQVAGWYQQRLCGDERIVLPYTPPGYEHVYTYYVMRVAGRDRVADAMGSRGITCGVHYPIPLHLQSGYRDLGYCLGDLPLTEAAAQSVLSLPMYPHLNEEQVDTVCRELKNVL